MARVFFDTQSNGEHKNLDFKVDMHGSTGVIGPTGPTLGNASDSTYVTIGRGMTGIGTLTGVTGTYWVKTVDPFAGHQTTQLQVVLAAPGAAAWNIETYQPVHNADGTWTFAFGLFDSTTATDLPVTNGVYINLVMRDAITGG